MSITRQHVETVISELAGALCKNALGVGATVEEGIAVLFLNLDGIWYRISIDVGVLFWTPGEPDPDVELDDGEQFIDLLADIHEIPLRVNCIYMRSGALHIEFINSHSLIITEDQESGLLQVRAG